MAASRGPAHPPLVRENGRLVETTWDVAMERVVATSRELLARPGGWGRIAFHTGTRLFLEEHYTLAVIGKAGIGTPHMDGDTRWGAAAAAAALAASFGTDGQPGSYTDVDHCDALALWGHDCAATHPVLWERMLDRRLGSRPPAMIVVGPEGTAAAVEADVHLAVRPGTNVALLNGLLHELIAGGWYDAAYVAAHTVGFERLWRIVEAYPAKRAAEICAVPVAQIEQAAEILGAAERLVSTVGPEFLGSNQATAAACQVNNVHLLRGMLGRPGAGLFQLGGPGCDALVTGSAADLPGLRNWADTGHVRELADLWNVDPAVIPHWGPATHATQILRYAEEGSIGLLWITASDPAATIPGFDRILAREDLLVVVQDAYLTETARLADVVLPAAVWGEKTGTVTGADRTVHLCEKAVEAPGRPGPTSTSCSTTRGGWTCATGTAGRSCTGRTPSRRSRRGRRAPGAVRATTPGSPTTGCAPGASSGPARRPAPTASSGCTPGALRHQAGGLPDVRGRPRHGGRAGRGTLPRAEPRGTGVPPRRGFRAVSRGRR